MYVDGNLTKSSQKKPGFIFTRVWCYNHSQSGVEYRFHARTQCYINQAQG